MMRNYSLLTLLIISTSAWSVDHSEMDMGAMSGMDMSMHSTSSPPIKKTEKSKTKHHHLEKLQPIVQTMPTSTISDKTDISPTATHPAMSMSMPMHDDSATPIHDMDHSHMSMPMHLGSMKGSNVLADARSPDYSQGRDFGPIHPPMMMGNDPLMSISVNRLEWQHSGDNDGDKNQGAYELEGWWGDDWNRAVLKAEGTITDQNSNKSINDARTELLWRKPLSTFWNTELGVRQDSGYQNNRTWIAFGVNGISSYWIDLDATVYVCNQSQTELIFTGVYDWRITQRLILQPRVEISLYGQNDSSNDIGKGLSEVQSGLRLRYEISRQFSPYIGFESRHDFGKTADLLNASNQKSNQSLTIAGIMLWF